MFCDGGVGVFGLVGAAVTRADEPAFPTYGEKFNAENDRYEDWTKTGLTKREWMAAMAMQGLCLNTNAFYEKGQHNLAIALRAVALADCLIAELEKK